MNERIKELVGDATLYADSYFDRDCAAWSQIYNEKFAELIVRECADIATINQHEWHSAGSYVLKHFGVE
jgi:hypothetical protein